MDMKSSPLSTLADPGLLKTDGLIDGAWVPGRARFAVHDPATGQELTQVANLGPADAEAAIAAANQAWPAWRAKTAKERAAILMKKAGASMARPSPPPTPTSATSSSSSRSASARPSRRGTSRSR